MEIKLTKSEIINHKIVMDHNENIRMT